MADLVVRSVRYKSDCVDGQGTLRDDLRVSGWNTIYHVEKGVLCQGFRESGGWLFHPLIWKTPEAARDWIKKGTIGELQESLTNLAVGFRVECFKPNKW